MYLSLVASRLAIGRSYPAAASDVRIHLYTVSTEENKGLYITSLAGAPEAGECLIYAPMRS